MPLWRKFPKVRLPCPSFTPYTTKSQRRVIVTDAPAASGPPALTYDPKWLAITRASIPHISIERHEKGYSDEAPAHAVVGDVLSRSAQVAAGGALRVEDVLQSVMVVPGLSADEPRAPCESTARSQGVGWVCALTSILSRDAAPCYPTSQTVAFYVMMQTEKKVDCLDCVVEPPRECEHLQRFHLSSRIYPIRVAITGMLFSGNRDHSVGM